MDTPPLVLLKEKCCSCVELGNSKRQMSHCPPGSLQVLPIPVLEVLVKTVHVGEKFKSLRRWVGRVTRTSVGCLQTWSLLWTSEVRRKHHSVILVRECCSRVKIPFTPHDYGYNAAEENQQ